jgi:glyoxylase I family protein
MTEAGLRLTSSAATMTRGIGTIGCAQHPQVAQVGGHLPSGPLNVSLAEQGSGTRSSKPPLTLAVNRPTSKTSAKRVTVSILTFRFNETRRGQEMESPLFRVHGVRYQTRDVERAVSFYTQQLGFTLKHQQGSAFASVSCDGVDVLLSGPGSSGARPMPDGEQQVPGGWNRLVLAVSDLQAVVAALKSRGVSFRNHLLEGPGGKQIQILDPDGNPIELFEPAVTSSPPVPRRA